MKRIAVAAVAAAAMGLGACQGASTNSANGTVTINGAAIGESLENGLNDAGNFAEDAGNAIGNTASQAGDVIENNAKAAWNGVENTARDVGDGPDRDANTNTTGR